jgi:hypothetical protein
MNHDAMNHNPILSAVSVRRGRTRSAKRRFVRASLCLRELHHDRIQLAGCPGVHAR